MSGAPTRRAAREPELVLTLSFAPGLSRAGVPGRSRLTSWLRPALARRRGRLLVALRFLDEAEAIALNRRFRGRDYPPNVLAFPSDLKLPGERHLGDIALCLPVARREASEQGKAFLHHLAHLLIHATLHLLGHDHEDPAAAERMETLERRLLARLGIADPYDADADAEARPSRARSSRA